jgi:L-2-hydroxyglutarate oxidase LhgO
MTAAGALDVAVIGGGIIGLAVARALALRGRDVALLEAEGACGLHASSRNSEVIHAGLYDPPGSHKAVLCVRGRPLLYAYAERERVPHRRLGKLVVATRDEEIPALERIFAQAAANGVNDLAWLDASDVRALEPAVRAVRGFLSPSTGSIDSHALMAALRRDAVEAGASIVLSTPVVGGAVAGDGFELTLGGREATSVRCAAVVNAAGLRAPSVTRSIAGLPQHDVPREYFAKGHYFALRRPSPFRHLVYPVPAAGGLGVHVTLDLGGQARFGPDVAWVDNVEYAFDETRAPAIYGAVRAYFPGLADGDLAPAYTGVRPKLGPAGTSHDFRIDGPAEHGVPGFVALYGIESPGLTASLALADDVATVLG